MNKKISFLIALITILLLSSIVIIKIYLLNNIEVNIIDQQIITQQKDKLDLYHSPLSPLSELIMNSDLVCYAEILEVDKEIEIKNYLPMPGEIIYYPNQNVKARCLKVLIGPEEIQGREINVLKTTVDYYLKEGQKEVLYLLKDNDGYVTNKIHSAYGDGRFPHDGRLPHALSEVNILRRDKLSGAIISLLGDDSYKGLSVHIFKGRQEAPISLINNYPKEDLLKVVEVSDFNIVEVSLEYGSYTFLLEVEENLYSFSRLVNGYYPYLSLSEERDRNWLPIYFNLEEIIK